jgi:hypothetical protein
MGLIILIQSQYLKEFMLREEYEVIEQVHGIL